MNPDVDLVYDSPFRLEPRKDQPLVFDVYDKDRKKLTKAEARSAMEAHVESLALPQTDTQSFAGRPKVCGEGDSWINILWPISSALGHERTFYDVIQRSRRYDMRDFGFPGDTFDDMLAEKEYEVSIKSGTFDYFIFSGGGNDVLGGGALTSFLKRRNETDPDAPVEIWLNMDAVNDAFEKLREGYTTIAAETEVWANSNTTLLIHGYDYAIPRPGGEWIGTPLEDLDYDLVTDSAQIRTLIKHLVDEFYSVLGGVAANSPVTKVMNLRNIINGRWNDELHAKTAASQDIAALYMNVMSPGA